MPSQSCVPYRGGEITVNCASGAYLEGGPPDGWTKCTFNGGDLLVAMFTLQMGAQGLGLVEPAVTAFTKARKVCYEILKLTDRIPLIDCFSEAREACFEILKLTDRIPEIDCFSEAGLAPANVKGDITFDNVHFAYPSRPDQMVAQMVAQGYNLTIAAGQTVALVGASGSGKSTA
ncbi:hypothetical protein T484DRAFT_1771332, partial [Baffinella frigidus]